MKQKLMLFLIASLFLGSVFSVQSFAGGAEKPKAVPISKADDFAPFFPEQNKNATLCLILNDDGTPVTYGSGFDSGMGLIAYLDPALCAAHPTYPFRITNIQFYLYHDTTANFTWPVNIQVRIKNALLANKCLGPDTLTTLCSQTFTIPIDSSFDSLNYRPMNLTLSPPCCVYQPFFLEIDYLSHPMSEGVLPGFLLDVSVASADTCNNWGMEGETYFKWSDFWVPPAPGDVIIQASGFTDASECDTGWYWKADRINAPSGMVDFDQNQPSWVSYCGPVAAANCLWWYGAVPVGWNPPQLIDTLARYFHTDSGGTYVDSMLVGLMQYFHDYGLAFEPDTFWFPNFTEMEDSLKVSQDILLLLGFWWFDGETWYREGGHLVTMAGVFSESLKVALSDPDRDNAESGGLGRVRPPHISHPQDHILHNDPTFISHDIFNCISDSGYLWEITDYISPTTIGRYSGMNIQQRFIAYTKPASKTEIVSWHTEVEAAIMICPKPSAVEDKEELNFPRDFQLYQNYPNPFNPTTTIHYSVKGKAADSGRRTADGFSLHTTLKIYNIRGQLVKTLVNEPKSAGDYEVVWDGKDEKGNSLASGIYFYQIVVGEQTQTRRMLLLK